jgi:hypothetical protein
VAHALLRLSARNRYCPPRSRTRTRGVFARSVGSCGATGLFHEYRVGCQCLEAKVDCSANRTSSMNCCGWNCDGLPRTKPQFYAALQVDHKQAFYDKKQLIGGWMEMPWVHIVKHSEAQTTPIYPADYRVSIGLRNSSCLTGEVCDHKRWIFDRFVRIRIGCNHMSRIARHRLSARIRPWAPHELRSLLGLVGSTI